eukprot:Skav224315  [mRNA]  locus=scaffold227:462147:463004:- [translate_table: standard]
MCWLCAAKHQDYKDLGPNDRRGGLDKAIFVQRVLDMKKDLCPFWERDELHPRDLCLPDWLHAVDQGIGADIAGQILVELARKMPERSFAKQVTSLWLEIQDLYKGYKVESKLASLSPGVLNKDQKKKNDKVATLKGPAAPVRHLVLLLQILTAKYFAGGNEHQEAVHRLAKFLARTYMAMETNDYKELQKQGDKVARQYMALEREALVQDPDSKDWHIMPKLHMFQHIVESGFPPKDYWRYKDETCGGVLAKLFERKGGPNLPGKNAENALLKWQQESEFPCIPY